MRHLNVCPDQSSTLAEASHVCNTLADEITSNPSLASKNASLGGVLLHELYRLNALPLLLLIAISKGLGAEHRGMNAGRACWENVWRCLDDRVEVNMGDSRQVEADLRALGGELARYANECHVYTKGAKQ